MVRGESSTSKMKNSTKGKGVGGDLTYQKRGFKWEGQGRIPVLRENKACTYFP